MTIEVDYSVSGLTGTELDGEVYNPHHAELPSGDGINGGIGIFRINVLQGDANRDGIVDEADQSLVEASLGQCDGQVAFDPLADLNSDGCVDDADAQVVELALGQALPVVDGNPPAFRYVSPAGDLVTIGFNEAIMDTRLRRTSCYLTTVDGEIILPRVVGSNPSHFGSIMWCQFDEPLDASCSINITNMITDESGQFIPLLGPLPCE